MEKLFVTLSLVAAIGLSAAISPQNQSQNPEQKDRQRMYSVPAPPTPPAWADADTIAEPAEPDEALVPVELEFPVEQEEMLAHAVNDGIATYHITVDGKQYEIVKKGERIIYLAIDEKEIPAGEYRKYKATIDKIEKEVNVQRENAEQNRREAEKQRAEADVHRQEAQEVRLEAEKQRAEAYQQRQLAAVQRVQAEEQKVHADQMRKLAGLMREQAEAHRIEADKMREEADKQRAEAGVMREKAEKERADYEKKQTGLINDLIEEGVIKNTDRLSFFLGKDALIVNGKKQSPEMHEKLKSKYLEGRNAEMVYNYKGRTGYTITGLIHEN